MLPTGDSDLSTGYTVDEVLDVASDDDVYVCETALSGYVVHQYKVYAGSQTKVIVRIKMKSSLAPSGSTAYLQVYNQVTSAWGTIDTDNTTAADTEFYLEAYIADLTNYKDSGGVVSMRIYQQLI